MSGTIPASLSSLSSLAELYLNKNLLEGTLPASLGSFGLASYGYNMRYMCVCLE